MPDTSLTDHLTRLRTVLAEARHDYEQLQYLSLDGIQEITLRSSKRTVTLAVAPAVGVALYTELTEAAAARVQQWEEELAEQEPPPAPPAAPGTAGSDGASLPALP